MNAYEKIAKHHAEHIYKKGVHKGDAPVEGRGKRHFRVVKLDNAYAVRMYETNIMVITPDNKLTVDCNGYFSSTTTRANLNTALFKFCAPDMYAGTRSFFSYTQPVFRNGRQLYRYYDGLTIDLSTRQPLTELKPLQRKRISATKVAQLNRDIQESGFKDAFKMLWAIAEEPDKYLRSVGTALPLFVETNAYSECWPVIVSRATYNAYNFERDPVTGFYTRKTIKNSASVAWANIMRDCKQHMYEIVDTDVYAHTV